MNVAHVYDIYTDGRLSGRQIVNIESKKEGVYLCLTSKLETFLGVEVVQMVVENEKHHLKRICVEKMYNYTKKIINIYFISPICIKSIGF
ncbi:hypothetical protein [Kosmotoga sp. DU53]|uniref:hypothetical protein n=1 Tax=Kosmotoga sp. DU53 TaxID=1310160 RepID=UPI0007C57F0A|nr:hypothetical protein [Kosmotoga sp. DU53]OAA19319.1 hypothetical protein DU53_10725 [Kosmotoga sp. DU53]